MLSKIILTATLYVCVFIVHVCKYIIFCVECLFCLDKIEKLLLNSHFNQNKKRKNPMLSLEILLLNFQNAGILIRWCVVVVFFNFTRNLFQTAILSMILSKMSLTYCWMRFKILSLTQNLCDKLFSMCEHVKFCRFYAALIN